MVPSNSGERVGVFENVNPQGRKLQIEVSLNRWLKLGCQATTRSGPGLSG